MITRDNALHPHLHIDGVYTQRDHEGGSLFRVVLRGVDTAEEAENEIALVEDLDGIGLVNDVHGYAPIPLWAFESMWEWSGTSSDAPSDEALRHMEEGTAVVPKTRRRKAKRAKATGERRLSPSGDGEARFDHNQEMLSRAFGLSDEWYHNTDALIEELYADSDKMTQVAVRLVKEVRAEELGIDHLGDFSDYEMKLFYSGFMLAQTVSHYKHRHAMMDMLMASMLADAEKSESGDDPMGGILGGLEDLLRQLKKRKDEDEDNSDDTDR